MDKKLTLSLNAVVVEKAKVYAKEQGISLSRMIENYLALVAANTESKMSDDGEISPLVKKLSGVVDLESTSSLTLKDDYSDYLAEKYK